MAFCVPRRSCREREPGPTPGEPSRFKKRNSAAGKAEGSSPQKGAPSPADSGSKLDSSREVPKVNIRGAAGAAADETFEGSGDAGKVFGGSKAVGARAGRAGSSRSGGASRSRRSLHSAFCIPHHVLLGMPEAVPELQAARCGPEGGSFRISPAAPFEERIEFGKASLPSGLAW